MYDLIEYFLHEVCRYVTFSLLFQKDIITYTLIKVNYPRTNLNDIGTSSLTLLSVINSAGGAIKGEAL